MIPYPHGHRIIALVLFAFAMVAALLATFRVAADFVNLGGVAQALIAAGLLVFYMQFDGGK